MQSSTAKAQDGADPSTSGLRNSPHTPASGFEQEHHINELISQYSGPSSTANAELGHETARVSPVLAHPRPVPGLATPSKSVGSLLGNASKVTQPVADGSTSSMAPRRKDPRGTREARTNNPPTLQMSEGSSPSIPALSRHPLPSKPKKPLVSAAQTYSRPQTPLLQGSLAYRLPSRMSMPPQRSPRIATRREAPNSRHQQSARGDGNNHHAIRPGPNNQPSPQTAPHHQNNQESRQPDAISNDGHAKPSIEGPRVPTLAQLLIHDPDLNDWLQITNYFDLGHREKVLKRHRALLELDEQRRKLLAEIEADEQGPILLAPLTQLEHENENGNGNESENENMNMFGFEDARQIPNRDVKMEFLEAQNLAKIDAAKVEAANVEAAEQESHRQGNRVVSNKRAYSEVRDTDDRNDRPKLQRTASIRRQSTRYDSYRPSLPTYNNRPVSPTYAPVSPNWVPFSPPSRGRGRSPDRSRYHDDPRFPSPRRLRSSDCLAEYGVRRGPERVPFAERGAYHGRGYDPDSRRYRSQRRRRSPTPPPPARRRTAVANDGKVPFDGPSAPAAPRGDLGSRITRGKRGG